MKALLPLFRTDDTFSTLLLRLTLGGVFLPHGLQKTFGLFGGKGFSATLHGMNSGMGIPVFFVFLAIMAEFAGALGLIFGLLTRVAAFGIGCTMVVAIAMVHGKNGFFMTNGGIEYHLLAIGVALVLILKGGGRFSADAEIAHQLALRDQYSTR